MIRIFLCIMLMMIGWVDFQKVAAQTYRERQLRKLYLQKTQQPTLAEQRAQQKKWNQLRKQYQSQQRLKQKKQTEALIRFGKKVESKQAQTDLLTPLKQQTRLQEALHLSSFATKESIKRKKERNLILKRRQKYRYRNLIRPAPPVYRNPYLQR